MAGIIREFSDFESVNKYVDVDPYNFLGGIGTAVSVVTSPAPPYGDYTLQFNQEKTQSFFRTPLFTYTSGTKMITACYAQMQNPPGGYPLGNKVNSLMSALDEFGGLYWKIGIQTDGLLKLTDASGTLRGITPYMRTWADTWLRIEVVWEPGNASSDYAWYVTLPGQSSILRNSGSNANFVPLSNGVDIGLRLGGQVGNPLALPIKIYNGGSYMMENIDGIQDRIGASEGKNGDWISIIDGGKSNKNDASPHCSESGTVPGDDLTAGVWANIGDDLLSTSGMYTRAPGAPSMGGGVRLDGPRSTLIDKIYASKWIWYSKTDRTMKAVYGKYNYNGNYDVGFETADSMTTQLRYYRHIEDASGSRSPEINELYVIGMYNDSTTGRTSILTTLCEGWCYSLSSIPLTYIEQIDDSIPLYIGAGLSQNNKPLYIKGFGFDSDDIDLFIGGYIPISGQKDCFIKGHVGSSGDISLYIRAFDSIDDNIGLFIYGGYDLFLFIEGVLGKESSTDLYTLGYDINTGSADLFMFGGKDVFLYIHGSSPEVTSISNDIPLFIKGHIEETDDIDLFIHGLNASSGSIDLFIGGFIQTTRDIELFIQGQDNKNGDVALYIRAHASSIDGIDLFIYGYDVISGNIDLFIRGFMSESGQIPLFIGGIDSSQNNIPLFIRGYIETINSIDLFIGGLDLVSGSMDLYLYGHIPIINDIPLFVNGLVQASGDIELFIIGKSDITDNIDLYIYGKSASSGLIDLFTVGLDSTVNDTDLFINGHIFTSGSTDLFLGGQTALSGTAPLFIVGYDIETDEIPLFINSYILSSGNIPCFISGIGFIQDSTDLIVHGSDAVSDNIDLFIMGTVFVDDDIILYMKGSGIIPQNASISLLINGLTPKEPVFCPILDPTASIQISDMIIRIYQENIDALINQLGKNTLLTFDPEDLLCPNCFYDDYRKRSTGVYKTGGPVPFQRGRQCPYCKGKGVLATDPQKCIKCLVKWRPKGFENYGISVTNVDNIVRLKTYIIHMNDLIRAKTATVSYDSVDMIDSTVKRIIDPVPIGLREDRYCVSFWELL